MKEFITAYRRLYSCHLYQAIRAYLAYDVEFRAYIIGRCAG